MLFISGSGQENRDEEIFDHKPFLVIADYLARQGIASLRYDDRNFGASKGGDLKNVTSEGFARDAAAGLEYLRSRKAFGKVGVIGHSEGGLIGFILGAQGLTDFLVSLAGTGVKGDTLVASQQNRALELMGMPATATVEKIHQDERVQNNPWLRWNVNYDPSENISKTKCPVFALNGDLDWQVISSLNLPGIERNLPKSKKNLIKVSLKGTTIPHEVIGAYGAGRVLMKPAAEGTGVIAGGPARAVLETVGIKNIRTKALRSNNPCNVVRATIQGLASLRSAEEVAAIRGKSVKEILG